jgi:hypothetical protein
MRRALPILFLCTLFITGAASAQNVRWVVGGNMGLSIGSGGGGSSAGFHFGPMTEVLFGKGMAAGTEFNINTQAGTPIEWAAYFKYYFAVSGSKLKPYADIGPSLYFVTGGPYFGIRFGGGVGIPVAKNIFIGPDLQFGPVFTTGSTTFVILIRGGLRYEI